MMKAWLLLSVLLLSPTHATDSPPLVVTSVGMVADTVAQIAGPRVRVQSLMGPGTDPHLYRASAGDLRKLRQADLVAFVGLQLEGKMDTALRLKTKPHVALGDAVPVGQLLTDEATGTHDPHIWFDPKIWSEAARSLLPALTKLVPEAQKEIEAKYETWRDQVLARASEHRKKLQAIPKDRRVLITSHDAFRYLGRYFGLQVEGLQGISTESEAGLHRMKELINLVKSQKVQALFVESSVPPAGIDRLRQATGVRIGGELYSDALGPSDSQATTYLGMLEHNLQSIVKGLKAP